MSATHTIILILVLAAAGGGAYYVMQGSDDAMTSENATEQERTAESNETRSGSLSGDGSFFELMRLGQSVTCEYTYRDEDSTGSGVGYFANGNMRLDAETTADGEVFTSNMIHDGETLYMWSESEGETFAMMMAAPESEAEVSGDTSFSAEDQGTVPLDQDVEYECERWNTDASVFVPPSDLEFTDMNAMMNEAMQGMPEGFEMPEGMPGQQ